MIFFKELYMCIISGKAPVHAPWSPFTVHDVFSLDASVALNLRFEALVAPARGGGRRKKQSDF
jgi:hypothetical protein